MSMRYVVMLSAGLLLTGNAFAGDGEALAKKNNCLSCHGVDKKMVGPAFKDVAAKYKADKGAQATIEKKVRSGGSGSWGNTPMPPAAKTLGDDDIKSIVQWVLSLK